MKKYNIKELEEKLKKCKDIDLSEVNIDDIDDLSDILVKLEFTDNGKNAEDAIINVIKSIYK